MAQAYKSRRCFWRSSSVPESLETFQPTYASNKGKWVSSFLKTVPSEIGFSMTLTSGAFVNKKRNKQTSHELQNNLDSSCISFCTPSRKRQFKTFVKFTENIGLPVSLVFWKPCPTVDLKKVLSVTKHGFVFWPSANQTLGLRSVKHFRIAWVFFFKSKKIPAKLNYHMSIKKSQAKFTDTIGLPVI